jgi:maltooligosyltrehalose trehalohydrolase
MVPSRSVRRLPIGAEPLAGGGVHFRVWAPKRREVELVLERGRTISMRAEEQGYFACHVADAAPGVRYRFRLDDAGVFPDPASRYQPEGPHGPSEVVAPDAFDWHDAGWPGVQLAGAVLYELHTGTFTTEGTWRAAEAELPRLREIGITCVEMMPVAEFPGRFGWGYDGVDLFAPTRLYGAPDDLRRFIDRAHGVGIGVILDVVYNHLGPDGNYLREFSDTYFSDRYTNEWGDPINFDGEGSGPVRELFIANAGYWIDEFHFDGLRLDATQSIYDASRDHVISAIARRVREAARGRSTLLIAENETQDARLLDPPEHGGFGLDAAWNDDFHHTALVALTGVREAYYTDYGGTPQELVSAMKRGWLFQGQRYVWQKKRRGTPAPSFSHERFITYLENHDQVANTALGGRPAQQAHPGRHRALTALLLLGPCTPLLFQGEELGVDTPWKYFADHVPQLAQKVKQGRAGFMSQFPRIATPEVRRLLPDPGDPATFESCKLRGSAGSAAAVALHRDLIRIRSESQLVRDGGSGGLDGAVLSGHAFVLRWPSRNGDRLLVVNLGPDLRLESAPEPLLAPPLRARWRTAWSSEDPRYGGLGTPPLESDEAGWRIPAECAVLLEPEEREGKGK